MARITTRRLSDVASRIVGKPVRVEWATDITGALGACSYDGQSYTIRLSALWAHGAAQGNRDDLKQLHGVFWHEVEHARRGDPPAAPARRLTPADIKMAIGHELTTAPGVAMEEACNQFADAAAAQVGDATFLRLILD